MLDNPTAGTGHINEGSGPRPQGTLVEEKHMVLERTQSYLRESGKASWKLGPEQGCDN